MENEKVILFPKWKKTLEEESLLALKEKRYEEALHKLDQLIGFQVNNHEILMGKLICLMELDRYDDAEVLSEKLLTNKNENYFHYLHIYLTILFQTSQYNRLMERVEHEFEMEIVPEPIKEQFQQLYDMSQKMNKQIEDERYQEYINGLLEALEEENYVKQWRYVEGLRKLKTSPSKQIVDPLLKGDGIHPVLKTAVFRWLQDSGFNEIVEIHKSDIQLEVVPTEITEIESHGTFKQILLLVNKIEQKNPSLYQLVETLLYRYIYVRYPIMPASEDSEHIATALTHIGKAYLGIPQLSEDELDPDVLPYKEEIQLCEKLYLSIIEE